MQNAIEAMLGIKAKIIVNISPANPPLMIRTTLVTDQRTKPALFGH